MAKNYAGLKRVGYSADKAATKAAIGDSVTVTWVTGKVGSETTINPEAITNDTPDGNVSAGGTVTPEIHILDYANFATLEGFGDADTEHYWYAEFIDGRIYVTNVPTNIQVIDPMNVNIPDGVSGFIIQMLKHDIKTNVFRNLPAS